MSTKFCTGDCSSLPLPIGNFYLVNGRPMARCKPCVKKSREKYREERLKYEREYNKTRNIEYTDDSRAKNNDARKKYYRKNSKEINQKEQERLKVDTQFALRKAMRTRLRMFIRSQTEQKLSSTCLLGKYLSCTWLQLRDYIESQFENGMTWNNHGNVWHIDHVVPMALFDLENEEHLSFVLHWCNLQPLFCEENLKKSSKVLHDMIKDHDSFNIKYVVSHPDLKYKSIIVK